MMWWLTALAHAQTPASVDITYAVTFDLAAMADQVCGITGICDCNVTYQGSGQWIASDGDRHTWRGTWRRTSGGCHDALEFWVPSDGEAFHTLVLSEGAVREWIAHGRSGDRTRITSNIKAGQQVWLSQMSAAIVDQTATHFESAAGDAQGIGIQSSHRLSITLTP